MSIVKVQLYPKQKTDYLVVDEGTIEKEYLLKGIGSYNIDRRKVKIISLGINIK